MTRYHVLTTTNATGWGESGRRMAESFVERWPATAKPLTLYAEGFDVGLNGVEVRRLPAWLDDFKRHSAAPSKRGQRYGRYDYRFDAVKFAHKVAALTDFGKSLTDGVMIWLDADTFTHARVTQEWLDGLFTVPGYMAWLDRANNHPECGFVMFRCDHPHHRQFMDEFENIYRSGAVFNFAETHDSYVLQQLANAKVAKGKFQAPHSLSGDARNWHHPFCAGPLGACLDHMKGKRKRDGRSPRVDARGRREAHWTA